MKSFIEPFSSLFSQCLIPQVIQVKTLREENVLISQPYNQCISS